MSWLTGNRGANTYICIDCRYVTKSSVDYDYNYSVPREEGRRNHTVNSFTCPKCQTKLLDMGMRWRPPKKNNHKAWKMIANGDYWWDKKAVKVPEFVAGQKGRKGRWIDFKYERQNADRNHITKFVDGQRHELEN